MRRFCIIHLCTRAGSIGERLGEFPRLFEPNSMVIDPDSRLSQLGLLPVCEDEHYFFSRAEGMEAKATRHLSRLPAVGKGDFRGHGCEGLDRPTDERHEADIAMSFGVGDNAEKRVDDPFEEELLRGLTSTSGAC